MNIDYKKELEASARNMILVHEPHTLIKMIIEMLVEKAGFSHASVLIYDKAKDSYLLNLSHGSLSKKVPVGLARIDKDDALIRFFSERRNRRLFTHEAVFYNQARSLLGKKGLAENDRQILMQMLYQMSVLDTAICVPSYFREELLAVFLLGKKKTGNGFDKEELNFLTVLASNAAMAIRNAQLFSELERELVLKNQLFIRTTIALAAAIEAKDNYTHGHTTRVANFSMQIAREISRKRKTSFDGSFMDSLHLASLLHDIGKIGVPEYILNKKTQLTVGERNKIKQHPLMGVTILKPIRELESSLPGVKHHHERFDGAGYPDGLKGKDIPLMASIISVADSFDAMTSNRTYRPAFEKSEAVKEIRSLSSSQFDPEAAGAFLELCRGKDFL